MSTGITGQQLQAPLILTWPETAASFEYDGGATKNILFTAVAVGLSGNDIDIEAESSAEIEPLSVAVVGTDITISLECESGFESITTAAELVDLINNDPAASALVVASLANGSDGSGVIGDGDLDGSLSGGLAAGTITFPPYFAVNNQLLTVFEIDENNNFGIVGIDNETTLSGDVTGSGLAVGDSANIATTLADSGVDPDTYTNPVIVVDSKGRITDATNGPAAFPFPIYTNSAPTTGQTVSAGASGADETLGIGPLGTLAELTIALPSTANTRVGQIIRVFINQTITTLTVIANGSGVGVAGPLPDTSAPDSMFAYQARTTSTWSRIY